MSVPELLTQEEAVRLLRLDVVGVKKPLESLRHLRRTGRIGYVKVAGKVLIPRDEIAAYVERQRVASIDGVPGPWSNRGPGGPGPYEGR